MSLSDSIVLNGDRAMCKSYAKINLTLDVLNKRDDGYHNIRTIMQSVSLFDLLIIDKCDSGISIKSNLKYLPNNEKNIAYKAAAAFFKATGINGGMKLLLHKNIPLAAGLAGGSGNGAVVLLALNALYNYPMSNDELLEIGSGIGADIPFCMIGGTAICEGTGADVIPISGMKSLNIVLVKPNISVSTAEIYEKIDSALILEHPNTDIMSKALENNDFNGVTTNLCNVMESVTASLYLEINEIKKKMLTMGAGGAIMSGSGPTIFGIFSDEKTAKECANSFYGKYRSTFVCNTI